MKNYIIIFLMLLIPFVGISQSQQPEVYPEEPMNCMQFGEANEILIEQTRNTLGREGLQKTLDECHTYPVTVFILHVGEPIGTGYNLSDNQVESAIESLNVYWHNDSIYEVDTAVALPHNFPLAQIVRINLAEYFPDYATEGISTSTSPSWSGQGVSCGQIWTLVENLGYDRNSNFHIYSYNYVGNILGFAWVTQMNRGAWVRFNRFGDFNWEADGEQFIGNPNNKTTVHEVGHVFGLRHTFDNTNSDCTPVQDESNCLFVNDRVCDTPVQTVTWGCGPTCGENPRNHMGYRSCRDQFTQGQLERTLLVEASHFDNFRQCPDVEGCTNELACNFNPDATLDDGSCILNGDTCTVDGYAGSFKDCECTLPDLYLSNISLQDCSDSTTIYFKTWHTYDIDSMVVDMEYDYDGWANQIINWETIYEGPFEFQPDSALYHTFTVDGVCNYCLFRVRLFSEGELVEERMNKYQCIPVVGNLPCNWTLENGVLYPASNTDYFAIYIHTLGTDIFDEFFDGVPSDYPEGIILDPLPVGQVYFIKTSTIDGGECHFLLSLSNN